MKYLKIPNETVRRLPMYVRALSFLQEEGQMYASSQELSEELQVNPPQIRKDLSYFGAFGTRGIGYHVENLLEQIRKILKLNSRQEAALVGAGRLGKAISLYPGFEPYGFDISAIFDTDTKKIGKRIGDVKVEDATRIDKLKKRNIKLAILAVPADTAQQTATTLVKSGIRGILNLSPCHLKVPAKVKVINIDIAMELGILPYYT
jgi:redox-sensing transcriptional repressor